jgi:hypothetical protein
VGVGANGIADTPDPTGGDDVRTQALGTGNANATVVRCGPNLVADTTANNFDPTGDDQQLIAPGGACAQANNAVVDAGPDGIAQTRAEGPDLLIKSGKRVKVNIRAGQPSASKQVKVLITNAEFGDDAPASRSYTLVVDEGKCPADTVSQVDADGRTEGLQATAEIPKDGKMKATFLVSFNSDQINTVSKRIPYRCVVEATAIVADPSSFDDKNPDDDRQTENNNRAHFPIEVVDKNDLP